MKLFKKSAKKSSKDVAEPVAAAAVEEKAVAEPVVEVSPAEPIVDTTKEIAEPTKAEEAAPEEDTLEALPEVKANDPAKDDASTVAESKDGDAPAPQAEAGTEFPTEESAEVPELVIPASIAVEENMPAKSTGWFSCAMCA